MGLPPINLAQPYPAIFASLGPVKPDWLPDILNFIHEYWTGRAIYHPDMPPRIKFETSNLGYPHCHVAIMWTSRQYLAIFNRRVQKYMQRYKHVKPAGYSKELDFSFRMYQVPITELIGNRSLRGAALVNHYLDNPTKCKSTDGVNHTIELTDFNAGAYIVHLRELADDPYESQFCDYKARATKAEKWAKRYYAYCKTHDMPDLIKTFHALDDCPDLLNAERSWHFMQIRSGKLKCGTCKFCKL